MATPLSKVLKLPLQNEGLKVETWWVKMSNAGLRTRLPRHYTVLLKCSNCRLTLKRKFRISNVFNSFWIYYICTYAVMNVLSGNP
jgi:hypothetical protein